MTTRMVLALWILSLASVPLCAEPLPVLFVPPPHYRVLKRLEGSSWAFSWDYGGAYGSLVNASILRDFRHAATQVGANAILLRPLCTQSWYCDSLRPPGGTGPVSISLLSGLPRLPSEESFRGRTFQSYTAEAIRVAGPPCPNLPGLCRLMQPQKPVARSARYRLYNQGLNLVERYRAIGLSLSLPGPVAPLTAMQAAKAVRIASTRLKGAKCPDRGPQAHTSHGHWAGLPILADPMLATIEENGQIKLTSVVFLRPNDYYASYGLVRLMGHLHFNLKPIGGKPLLLLVDWHVVLLAAHEPIPGNVICWYPGYPARYWHHGRMAAQLRWRGILPRQGGRVVAIDPVAMWPHSRK